MATEPAVKRVVAFFDGQNLFHNAAEAFGYTFPNYDVQALTASVAANEPGWNVAQIRFYTGVPDHVRDPIWNHFWNAKLAAMGRQGIYTYQRALKYRTDKVKLPDGSEHVIPTKQEKGIDVRLALDVVRLALDQKYDQALIFSQDQDLSEVADEIKAISILQKRWIGIASAFPVGPGTHNKRGINKTKWIDIQQHQYDSCLDPRDYRPPRKVP